MRNRLIILFCIGLLSPLITIASSDTLTHRFTLANGLRVVFREDHRANVVMSSLWYTIGSSDEPNGKTGLSHALEHMLFEGTTLFPKGEFNRLITQAGGQFNAETDFDFTHYFETLSADKLELALKLEADRMQHMALTDEAFKKELQVVQEERRLRIDDNPVMLAYERFFAAANLSNPYHHLPIGWPSDIAHLTKQNIQKWYSRWYTPNNAVLVIVGDEKPEYVKTLCETYFGPIEARELPARKPHPPQAAIGKVEVSVNIPAHVPTLIMGYRVPAIHDGTQNSDPYVLDLIATILDGGQSAMIASEIIRGTSIASEASVSYTPYSRFNQQFIFSGTPAPNHTTDELIAALKTQIKILQERPVKEEVLKRVITQITAAKIYQRDTLVYQAEQLGLFESLHLPKDEFDHYLSVIQKITPVEIQRVAKRYLNDDHLTLTKLVPKLLDKAQESA